MDLIKSDIDIQMQSAGIIMPRKRKAEKHGGVLQGEPH